ncbi:MAG: hypothetical protein HF309_18805, partial [Ignavibacteria bacterium]|nr:hypothetical protein [Ignavibacteria bacterium]
MKTYIHPVITLPAGEVQVTFYDASKEDGAEATPDIIMEIGEVEEGFDMNLGELRVPSCEFTLANLQGYALSTLLDTENLSVLVTVDNDLYFYGDFSLDFEPDVLELEAAIYGQIRLQAVSAISRL